MLSFKPTFSTLLFHFHKEAFEFLFTFCHKGGVICLSEVIDISPGNLDSSLCFFQPSVSHDVLCIQVSQEAGQVVWYSHLLKNFPQFIVIHTVKGFGIVNKAEIDVFLELSCFFYDPADVDNLISGSSAFSRTSLNICKFTVHILLKPGLENFEHYFTSM